MELEEIQGFDAQVLQAPLDEGGEMLVIVALGGMRVETTSCLGGDEDLIPRSPPEQPADEPLAAAVAVNVGGVEEVDAEVYGPVQSRIRFLITHLSPLAPEGPGPEA